MRTICQVMRDPTQGQMGHPDRARRVRHAAVIAAPPRGPDHRVERTFSPALLQYFSVSRRGWLGLEGCPATTCTKSAPFGNGRPSVVSIAATMRSNAWCPPGGILQAGMENGASIAATSKQSDDSSAVRRSKGAPCPGNACTGYRSFRTSVPSPECTSAIQTLLLDRRAVHILTSPLKSMPKHRMPFASLLPRSCARKRFPIIMGSVDLPLRFYQPERRSPSPYPGSNLCPRGPKETDHGHIPTRENVLRRRA